MKRLFNRCALAVMMCCGSLSTSFAQQSESAPAQEEAQDVAVNQFLEAEQLVHGYLYDAMLNVWSEDRRSWNQLLHVHACGGDNQDEKLSLSYENAQPLFSRSMLAIAEHLETFPEPQEQAILSDVAQLAYRLFSASYAHGYARQVQRADELSPGLQEELCGSANPEVSDNAINYPVAANWQLELSEADELNVTQGELSLHAEKGYSAFNRLLSQQYAKFDALVFSHAYQDTDAYDQLFFEVNRYENVQAYNSSVTNLVVKDIENQEIPHADFAYLVLSSGYHWGTLSVLAMLEEEYPRLHVKAKDEATDHIQKVTSQLSAQQEEPQASDSVGS